jgi:Ca2+-binding RTX toxin-like protein
VPNNSYIFANLGGQTIAFDPATDVLSFGMGFSAAGLRLIQGGGSGVNGTVAVTNGSVTVTLTGVSIDMLRAGAFSFADGSVALIGDGSTQGGDTLANTLNGGSGNDYLSGLGGADVLNGGAGNDMLITGDGNDTANGGDGDDTILTGSGFGAASRFDGGAGFDTVKLDAHNVGSINFQDLTVKNVERIELAGDGNAGTSRSYFLTTHDGTVASGATLAVDGTALDAQDVLNFDGSAELNGRFELTGGAGNDVLKGGAGADAIVGGAGNDTIVGGQGADVLTGGAGADTFTIARGSTRSDSSPTTIDRITDFEGAGVAGGDRIELTVPSGGRPLSFAGYQAFALGGGAQAPNVGDGNADIIYDHVGGQTRIAVDTNDDGLLTEVDQVILLDGIHTLQAEDFGSNISVVRGTANADTILGGGGHETIHGLAGNDIIDAGAGNDIVHAGLGNDSVEGNLGSDTLNGDGGDDTLRGGESNDTLNGGDGIDTLYGDADTDSLNGGAGNDILHGGSGLDTLNGDAGADTLFGGLDNDTLKGGDDADVLWGEDGNDQLDGGAGDDTLEGGIGNDSLTGGAGADTLRGGSGNDVLKGDDNGADAAKDHLHGEEGDDILHGGTGADVLSGGTGADRFVVTNAQSPTVNPNRITDFNAAEGDRLQLALANSTKPLAWYGFKAFSLGGGVQFPLAGDGLADAIWDYDAATNTTRIAVDADDDGVLGANDLLLYVSGQHDLAAEHFVDTFTVVRGGTGDDVIPGTAAADTYYGMGGNDTLTGEGGNDTLYGGDGNDNLQGGAGSDTLHGDAGDDTLSGGSENDTLSGGIGADQIDGGDGDDILTGGDGGDTVIGGFGNDSMNGNAGTDTLTGGDGNDTMNGGDDADQMHGGIGNDQVRGDGGNDTLAGGDGADTMTGGDGNDAIAGGDGDDTIDGNAGSDTIDGGAGNDIIEVGGGDSATGGVGADRFTFTHNVNPSTHAAQALVTDFQQGLDKVALSWASGFVKTWVFNGGDRALGTLSTAAGSQTILGNAGDSLHDVFYSKSADGLTTHLIVDLNDDGKLDAADLVAAFTGSIDFASTDFSAGTFSVLRGTAGDDVLTGTLAADTVYGLAGDDQITLLDGNDTAYGQAGNDTIDGGLGQDTLYGGDGNDTLLGGAGATLDLLHGGLGDDTLHGGDGDDQLHGNENADTIHGGLGADIVNGGTGNDIIFGGDGNDSLNGQDDNDQIDGGLGNDTLRGELGQDVLSGGDGNDTLSGGGAEDTLAGGDGDDRLSGDDGADTIDGGAGADTVEGGGGDTITGGLGADHFVFTHNLNNPTPASQARVTDFQQGLDKISLTWSSGVVKNWVLNPGDRAFGTLVWSGVNQTLLGNGGDTLHDVFYSTSADGLTTRLIVDVNDDGKLDIGDMVIAFDGDIDFSTADFVANTFLVLRGGEGDDLMTGTAGVDTYYGMGGNDTLTGDAGNDLLYGGNGNDSIDGGTGADTIWGEAGNDVLTGGGGAFADTIHGGAGDDSIDGGEGDDNLNGNDGADTIVGGLGADQVNGGAGADILHGNDGNDTLRGDADNDQIDGGLGNDSLWGENGNDSVAGGDGNDSLYGGAGDDALSGGEGDDSIDGGDGIDTVNGGGGNDLIEAGQLDVVTTGAGADRVTFTHNANASTLATQARVTDFHKGFDKIALSYSGGQVRTWVFNAGDRALGTLSASPVNPTLLGNAGDGLADIFYSVAAGGASTQLIVDTNDDGKLDAADLVISFDGAIAFEASDFAAGTFTITRGTSGDDVMTGTAGADTIHAVAGNDQVFGLAGADVLYGFTGNDMLDGGNDDDTLHGGDGADTLIGGAGGDTLNGDAGDDTLDGGDGADTLNGGDGLDTLRGSFGADTLNGGGGADTLEGGTENDTLNGGDGNDVVKGEDGLDTLRGDAGDDQLFGGALADMLTGGAGNDFIDGGTEVDTAVFSARMSEYDIIAENGGLTVRHKGGAGSDGTDFLINVEKLQFSDGTTTGSFLAVSDAQVYEGDSGTKKLVFTVSIVGTAPGPVTVNYATSNGTAVAGTDYVAASGTLIFAAGETSKTIEVTVNGDTTNEIDDTINLTLINASGLAIGDGSAVGTILNDDLRVSVANAEVTEGHSGTKNLTFTISLDAPAPGPVSVSWKTSDISATAGSDYTAQAGFIQFAAGEQVKTVTVPIVGDTLGEDDETFAVTLLSASGAQIANGTAVGRILNDDGGKPQPGADSVIVSRGATIQISKAYLLQNDVDPDGDTLSVTAAFNAQNGTVAILDQAVAYTAGGTGPAGSFAYTASDPNGSSAGATVTATIVDTTAGADTVNVGSAAGQLSHVEGLAGNDILNGGAGIDRLFGGDGNDILTGGAGADMLAGGAGDDTYVVDLDDSIVEAAGEGYDTVQSARSAVLGANFEALVLTGSFATNGVGNALDNAITGNSAANLLNGGAGNDSLAGADGDDALIGGEGADTLDGGNGNDELAGGTGNDVMRGGLGDDAYYVDTIGDTTEELDRGGTDTVFVQGGLTSWTLAAFVENLTFEGSGNFAGTGNALANILTGGTGDDTLDGGMGADTLRGGLGNDIYVLDNAGDIVIENAGEGIDEIRTSLGSRSDYSQMYALAAHVENLTGTSSAAQGVYGNALDNVVKMGAGGDLIVMHDGGVDTVLAGGGNDFIHFGGAFTAADTVQGGAGFDTIGLIGSYDLTLTATSFTGVEKLAMYSSGSQAVTNSYRIATHDANVASGQSLMVVGQSLLAHETLAFDGSAETDGKFNVRGGRGADHIAGGAQADQIWGNLGADMLRGGGGNDIFEYFAAAESTAAAPDSILDFTAGDRINLVNIDSDGSAANGNGSFRFIGSDAFSGQAGQLRAVRGQGNEWTVQADINGDTVADLVIGVTVADGHLLTSADFWV